MPTRHHAIAAPAGFSLLRSSGLARIAIAAGLIAAIWLGVYWAMH